MSHSSNVVYIASKLYEARDGMRRLFGEKYSEKISVYQEYIRAAMEKYSCDDLEATMKCVAVLQEKSPDSGIQQALILAACVEMIEPSETTKRKETNSEHLQESRRRSPQDGWRDTLRIRES